MTETNKLRLSEAQKTVVEENHKLIYWYMRKHNLAIDEYYDICAIALCKAVANYDPTKGAALSTFAYYYMNNAVRSYWRQKTRKCRTMDRIASSLSDKVYEDSADDKVSLGDIIPDETSLGQSPYYIVSHRDFIDSLRPLEKDILTMRMDGMTLREIGEAVGYSRTWVANILQLVQKKYITDCA